MNNRNILNDLDQLFQFVKSKKPLSKDDLLTCQNIIRIIQSQDSGILNTLNDDEHEFGLTLLMYTAKNHHREILNTLLDAKADPNFQNKYGMTALTYCSTIHDNTMIAKDLIDSGANMDLVETWPPGGTALMNACYYNHRNIAKLLIEKKANINLSYNGRTALSIALGNNNKGMVYKKIVLRLLNANAKIDCESWHIKLSKMERYLQIFKKYSRYYSIDKSFTLDKFLSNPKLPPPNRSALLEDRLSAIILKKKKHKSNQDIFELQQCLREIQECKDTPKPDINDALILAVYHRSTPFVIELLKAGANINYVDRWGRTALLGSVYDKNMFALLLEHGADLHLNNAGSARLIACCYDKSGVNEAQLLIKKGVDINYIPDQGYHSGFTPLIVSIYRNNEAVFDELLKAGADINKEDDYGRTPLYWAIDRERRVMIQKLIDAGCIFSQEDLNRASEVDKEDHPKSKDSQDSLYSFLTKLQETHPSHSAKSLLINQLDEEIGNHNYPMVLDLMASYDDRYNHHYFFQRKESIEKVEMKPESTSTLGEKQSLMDDVPFKCTLY